MLNSVENVKQDSLIVVWLKCVGFVTEGPDSIPIRDKNTTITPFLLTEILFQSLGSHENM